jgi:UDP-glucose 4-epimerase
MTTALVTGGTGFLGTAIVRALREAGTTVTIAGTSVESDPLTAERIATLPPVDLVVHCAGGSSVAASVADPQSDFDKTVPPLEALLEHVHRTMPTARFVLLSSAAVYGNAEKVPIDEASPLAPVSPYGVHKQRCEELCRSFGAHGIASAILRVFSVYGPGLRKQLLWDACTKARAGGGTFGGTGDEERDWLHVDDAVALVLVAANHTSTDVPVFNGGSGVGARVRDVVGQIFEELGAGTPVFNGQSRAGDPLRYIADITRATSLGWAPRVRITGGISQYVTWFRTKT